MLRLDYSTAECRVGVADRYSTLHLNKDEGNHMRKILIAVILLFPMAVFADYDYDVGSYWTVTGVDTKPGHFDDYMADINGAWRKSMEMLKADGKVLSYRMFYDVNAGHDSPDVWLMVEWKSAADMLDTPRDYFDKQAEKLWGSLDKGDTANIKRGELRTIVSESLVREMTFKK